MNNFRVYAIDIDQYDDGSPTSFGLSPLELTDGQFETEAERQGLVWTLKGFEEAINSEEFIPTNAYIRILNINSITQ